MPLISTHDRAGPQGLDTFGCYDEGYQIMSELCSYFPNVQVRPAFAQYVFSINERRESLRLLSISDPRICQAGYMSISDVRKSSSEFH